jgi:hypothetical protein
MKSGLRYIRHISEDDCETEPEAREGEEPQPADLGKREVLSDKFSVAAWLIVDRAQPRLAVLGTWPNHDAGSSF